MSDIMTLANSIDCDNALVMLPIIADAFEEEGDSDSAGVIRDFAANGISFDFVFSEEYIEFIADVRMKTKFAHCHCDFKITYFIPYTLDHYFAGRTVKLVSSTVRTNSLIMKSVAGFAYALRNKLHLPQLNLLYDRFLWEFFSLKSGHSSKLLRSNYELSVSDQW